ncbi:MAG TPA: leucyl/phenylalanyl-tRNA--protein transferase [Magnetospirillaceae bacterium]|nr:leucyl/phenylalanyl-tRNA--protein transferase [Magnetospirillaceae bacterium]
MSSPLTADQILRAYALGVFPMARQHDDPKLYWVDPEKRGILPLKDFHLPRSLKKVLKHGVFEMKIDTAFDQVLELCAESTARRPETWINSEIVRLFTDLHHAGLAHSVESWQDGQLVGGLYGLSLGSAFFGESMFSRTTDASKAALAYLAALMKKGGYTLLDTQFVTDHLAQFGAVEIPRRDYLRLLAQALDRPASFQGGLGPDEVVELLTSP